jgi:hypothetical protein
MTYENRMYARLGMPCLLTGMLGGLATWVTTTIADLPLRLGAPTSALADAPLVVAGLATAVTAGVVAWQAWRIRRWQLGQAPECLACGCLLGEERQRRWSTCRQCLGCGRFAQAG